MLNTPFSPWPSYSDEEAQAISETLLSNRVNYWTGGRCRQFENEFAIWVGARHAIALANGTLALDLALHGLGIGAVNGGSSEDEVIVTPRSFIASVSCVVNAGARPVFADVDGDSGNLSATTIKPTISSRTKAVIVVHLAGLPCEMPSIIALARQKGFRVIEDCAQAHGSSIKGKPLGSYGDVAAWSFCQDKIMTTGGEGGMVTCDDATLWERMWSYKDHGKSRKAVRNTDHPPGFRWLHDSFGTNWRMLEIQAAIGLIQLKRMASWHTARKRNAEAIWRAAADFQFAIVPAIPNGFEHAYYRAYVHIKADQLEQGWTRDRIVREIMQLGVPCYHGTCTEIYLEKAFDGTPWRPPQRLPVARQLGETSLMFLVHPTLTEAEITKTCQVIRKVFSLAQRTR